MINYKIKRIMKIELTIIIILLSPSILYAYIDPGIIGMLFQTVFAFIFGSLLVWFIKPYKYIVKLFNKIKSKRLSNKNINNID